MSTNQETKIELPKGFLLGAASAAHQVEGNNSHNDWWEYEQMGRLPKSGIAADHYNRYAEDFVKAKSLGLNSMRISVEWSRIEPQEGKWAIAEIEHYKKVLRKLKELGMTRMVTLHHFTLPQWLANQGGFETKHGIQAFARFAWFVASNLGSEVDLWVTLNEPEGFAAACYNRGVFPPFKKNNMLMIRVLENLILAHKSAYKAIKTVIPSAKIGIAKNCAFYEPYRKDNILDRLAVWASNRFGNHYFLEKISKQTDFIGLNYYFYRKIKFDLAGLREMNMFRVKGQLSLLPDMSRSDMGWPIYPEGIYYLLRQYRRYHKPIYITENGVANARDDIRRDFIKSHLHWMAKAIEFGVDVKGYFYWSLTDTYEWEDGYHPKFGLIEVDFSTQQRRVRESTKVFKEINFV